MNFEWNAVFSFTVGIGAVIGWVRVKKLDPAFLPFLWLLWIGFAHEIVSFFIAKAGYSNALTYNVFTLAEALLISFQFYKWGLFEQHQTLYSLLLFLFAAGWLTEFIMRDGFQHYLSYFIVVYATAIVFMAIHMLSNVLFQEPGPVIFQPEFLICMGLLVYFTNSILVEIFWLYGLNRSSVFRLRIYEIFGYINLFTNLVFAFATLWIPMKRQYILRSSLAVS